MSEKNARPPTECANCGTAIPRKAKACPECGADERTGWRENEDTLYDGLDLPESAYTDDSSSAAPPRRARRDGPPWYWIAVGLLLAALLILGVVSYR